MDYTMDTLSMEKLQPGDVNYTPHDSGHGPVAIQHGQQFDPVHQDGPDAQQYSSQTTLPRTSSPMDLVQADTQNLAVDRSAPELHSGYRMESYVTEDKMREIRESVPICRPGDYIDGSNSLATSAEMGQQQLPERSGFYYGDLRGTAESMEIDHQHPSSVYSETDSGRITSMEVENKVARGDVTQGSYEPVVSDFLPETPHTRETHHIDIPNDRKSHYTEAPQENSYPGNSQHLESSHLAPTLPDNIQTGPNYPQELQNRLEGPTDILPTGNPQYHSHSMSFDSGMQGVYRNTVGSNMSGDRSSELAQSLEAADAVAALASQSFEGSETATVGGESKVQDHIDHVICPVSEGELERQVSDGTNVISRAEELETRGNKGDFPVTEQEKYGPVRPSPSENVSDVRAMEIRVEDGVVEQNDEKTNLKMSTEGGQEAGMGKETQDENVDKDNDKDVGQKRVESSVAADETRNQTQQPEEDDDDATRSPQPLPVPAPGKVGDAVEGESESLKSMKSSAMSRVGTRKRFKCTMCKKSFRLKRELSKHMKTHSKASKKFPCNECSSSFNTKALLNKHQKIHKTKHYTCPECPTTCRSYADLKDHRRIHSNIRAFSCTECSYTAKRQKDLTKHMLVHSESKVHNCQFCKFSSKRKYSLQRHMKTSHSTAQIYECTICSFKTSAVDSFKVHVAMHAAMRTTSCLICGAVIKKRPNLIEHLLSHSNDPDTTCKECDETFTSSHEYILHLLSHKDLTNMEGNQGSAFDVNSSSLLNGGSDSASGAFGFMARKNKMTMDTPTMEAKISQMSSVASRLADMTKVVSLLNEKPKVFLQLGEISNLATELAVLSGNVLQSYKNTYNISTTNSKIKAPSTSSDVMDDSSFMVDEPSMSSVMNPASTPIKQELQDSVFGAADAGMQIQVDFNGDPISCVQKEDSYSPRGTSKSKGDKQLKCPRCNLMFTDTRSLKRHMMAHDDVRPYACEKCGQSFRRNEHLKKHMVTHSDERPYVCKECTYAAKTEHRLKIHMLCHSQTKAFACQHCNYTARTNYELNHHMKKHEPRTCSQCSFVCYSRGEMKKHVFTHSSFDCNECEFTTNDRSDYTKHMKKHSLVQHLCCELCGYSCDTMKKFKYHKLRHENKTPFQCPDCDYKCSSRASYDCHRLKHAGLKPYLCSFCGAAFRKTSHLNQHLLIHKDEKAFKCSVCGYACRTKHNLKEHEMTHSGEKPFSCKYCSFSCRRNKALQLHMLKHENQGMMLPPVQMPPMHMAPMQMPLQMPMMHTGL